MKGSTNNNEDLESQNLNSQNLAKHHQDRMSIKRQPSEAKLSDKDFFADFAQQMVLNIDEADQSHFGNYFDQSLHELSNSFNFRESNQAQSAKPEFEFSHNQITRSQSVLISPLNKPQRDLENGGEVKKKATLDDVAANQQRMKELFSSTIPNNIEEEDARSATHLYDSDESNSQATNSTFMNLQRSQQQHILLNQSDISNSLSGGDIQTQISKQTQFKSIYSRPFQTKPKKSHLIGNIQKEQQSPSSQKQYYQTDIANIRPKTAHGPNELQPRLEQLAEYDRLVELFIKEQTAQQQETWVLPRQSQVAKQPQLNPFNSSSQQRKLTRLLCSDVGKNVEQPTDDSIEEIIEIEQESLDDTQRSGGTHIQQRGFGPGSGSIASFTVDSNLGVLGQSQDEELKFQFAPFQGQSASTQKSKDVRLSYATDQSQDSDEIQQIQALGFTQQKQVGRISPQPASNNLVFQDLEALFCYNKDETLTMPDIFRQKNEEIQQETDEDQPFYIPRCLTEKDAIEQVIKAENQAFELFEERKSNKALKDESISDKDNSFTIDKIPQNHLLEITTNNQVAAHDDDLVLQNSPKKLPSPQSNRTIARNNKFSNFSASSLSDDRWLCPICLDIFQDAVETPCCNNLFCKACIRQAHTCPLCTQRIVGQLKPNIPIRRLVMELSIACQNENCGQVIKKCDVEKHQSQCLFQMVQCMNNQYCGSILRKDYDKHVQDLCPFREVSCLLLCGQKMSLNEVDQHIRISCQKAEIPCRNKCGLSVQRGHQDIHCQTVCKLEIVHCPNKGESLFEDGCPLSFKRKDLEAHKQQCSYRRVICSNQKCMSLLMFKDLNHHDERCLFKVIECENKCGGKFLRQNIQQHKDQCEFQLVKCPYYDLGCKIEVLRKDFKIHLMEESFNHSIIFIQGQQQKNQEIDLLRCEIQNLRKDYDCEVQWMFLELQRVKQDMKDIKSKDQGQKVEVASQISSSQRISMMKDERYVKNNQNQLGNSVQFMPDFQLQRSLNRQRVNHQQQIAQPSLDSVFNDHYLEHLPNSATQVASSLNNYQDGTRQNSLNRQMEGLSQINPLTSMQNKHPRTIAQFMGSQEEYKDGNGYQTDLYRENKLQEMQSSRNLVNQNQSSSQNQIRVRAIGSKEQNLNRHLDNSNVLYDLDFDIEEDKVNF